MAGVERVSLDSLDLCLLSVCHSLALTHSLRILFTCHILRFRHTPPHITYLLMHAALFASHYLILSFFLRRPLVNVDCLFFVYFDAAFLLSCRYTYAHLVFYYALSFVMTVMIDESSF